VIDKISGHSRFDKLGFDMIRDMVGIASYRGYEQAVRLRWCRHTKRRPPRCTGEGLWKDLHLGL